MYFLEESKPNFRATLETIQNTFFHENVVWNLEAKDDQRQAPQGENRVNSRFIDAQALVAERFQKLQNVSSNG